MEEYLNGSSRLAMGGMDWIDVAQDMGRGGFLQMRGPYNAANFLAS